MRPAGSKAVLVPRGNPAWTRQLCGSSPLPPSPALALLVLPSCVRAQKQHCTAIPVLALSHHGVRSCWQSVQGLPTARWDEDKDLVLPVLAEKTAAKPVGEIVCWKAGSGCSKAKVQSQPQHEGVESSRMQGKGLGDWGKDAKGSPGRRLIRFSGHHQPCPPYAHQTASRTSAACSPILLR